jgi:cold shock CspA family protein
MNPEHFDSTTRRPVPKQSSSKASRPNEVRGTPSTGRIARLLIGQSYGFIRMRDKREIYFHRSDVLERTAFNDLSVGDAVKFELLDDAVSGARALRVRPDKSR